MLLLIGCGKATDNKIDQLFREQAGEPVQAGQEPDKQQKKVALVLKTLTNPFFAEMEKGGRQAEEELDIRLIVKGCITETSIDQQISIIDELILAKVDAIVLSPLGPEVIPVLKRAQDAGIPVVAIDNRLDPALSHAWGLVNVPYISVDNEQGAYLSARFIGTRIHAPTKAVIVEGIRGVSNLEERKNGALRAFRENKNIQVVATETANCRIDEAYQVAAGLYQKYPDIGALFCANDMMALGVIRYLQETGRRGVLVAGYDALEEAKAAIRDGWLTVTIDQQARRQGYLGVKYAVDMATGTGQPVADKTLLDVGVVSLENLPQFP